MKRKTLCLLVVALLGLTACLVQAGGVLPLLPTPIPTSTPTSIPVPTTTPKHNATNEPINGEEALDHDQLSLMQQKLSVLYGSAVQVQEDTYLILTYENVLPIEAPTVFSIIGNVGIKSVTYLFLEERLEITLFVVADDPPISNTTETTSVSHYETCDYCNGACTFTCNYCYGSGQEECMFCDGEGTQHCYSCSGTGEVRDYVGFEVKDVRCGDCYGSGRIKCDICYGRGYQKCDYCDGIGYEECYHCDGKGKSLVYD